MSFEPNTPLEPNEDMGLGGVSLGSLKDKARGRNLHSARIALILSGVVVLIFAICFYLVVERESEDRKGPPAISKTKDELTPDSRLRILTLFCGGLAVIGVLFLIFAAFVKVFPLFCTVGGLILYVGINMVGTYLAGKQDPQAAWEFLIMWWPLKLIILAGLFKGIHSAVLFQRERAAQQAARGAEVESDI